jgi:hypothetical protein
MDSINYVNPYQDPSSYSHWKEVRVRNVNWDKLPATRTLRWHEVTKIRNAVSNVLIALAIATSTALFFTAAPIACTSICIGALAFLVTGIYLRMQQEHPLDPDFRMKKRNDIQDSSQIPYIGMLNASVARYIITQDEKQALLHQDINDTDYNIFITKHGQIIFNQLDKQNLSLLKVKFLAYLSHCKITAKDLQAIVDSKANTYFKLTHDDLMQFLAIENDQEELSEQEEPSGSTFAKLTSQVNSYVAPALKFATNTFVPSSIKAAGQLAMTSAQLAYQGKVKASAIYAANAITCLFIHSTKELMKVLYPEAYALAQQQIMYEKAVNS